MLRQWIYPPMDDPAGFRYAKDKNDESYTYYGEWYDDQPNGFGGLSHNGKFVEGGTWRHGELVNSISKNEYDQEMNRRCNSPRPHNW